MSLVMGATPNESPAEKERKELERTDRLMFQEDIKLIGNSPFGKTKEGGQIVAMLRELMDSRRIVYGPTIEGDRGAWDGTTITVDQDARGKSFQTALELVHEGAHALWRKNHPRGKGARESLDVIVNEELHARELQLKFYEYLRDSKGCPTDSILEMRLQRQANGTLRRTIAAQFE